MSIRSIFGRTTALCLIVLGASSLLFGAGNLVRWSLESDTPRVIYVTQPVRPASDGNAVAAGPASPSIKVAANQAILVLHDLESSDPDARQNAIFKLRALAMSDPNDLAIGLPQLVSPLLSAGAYEDVKRFALSAILKRPFDPVLVAAAQRARVLALIAQGDYPQALTQAKSYYDVASLAQTGEAVDLLADILSKTNGPLVAKQFGLEQHQHGNPSPVLGTIVTDPNPYHDALEALVNHRGGNGEYSHGNLMAQGNLLLLSDRIDEARSCFQSACRTESTANKNLRQAVEGLAEVIRARDGNIAGANAFVMSLRSNPEAMGESLSPPGSQQWEELRVAAQHTAISELASSALPAVEQQRARDEEASGASSPVPQIESGFEGSTPVYVASLSPTHLVVEITTPGFRDWFMFRLHGVANKTVRIDVTGAYKTVPDWPQKAWSLNPVYTDAGSLDDLAAFSTSVPTEQTIATNGPILPDTKAQSWHYISDVWSDQYTLSFVHHFDKDSAVVAMRVPRTPGYNERFLSQLAVNPVAKVSEIGTSQNDRPLLIAQIGTARLDKPCILLYAQEHADEQDAGWVAQGALEYLTSDAPGAAQIREHCTFLVIPTLDPDAAAEGIHQAMISSFLLGRTTPESVAYANWFQSWVNHGNRLDLVIDLHNVQSGEGPHVFCPLIEGTGVRGKLSFALHQMLLENMRDAGYGMQADPLMRGWMPDRLGGWLSHYYGPISIAYEVNSQAPERHLALAEVKIMGAVFVQAAAQFFASSNGNAVMNEVNSHRARRLAGWAAFSTHNTINDAIASEANFLKLGDVESVIDLTEKTIP